MAQTRRVLFAKQLIHDTRLPMTEVALAAGFGSVRRFNETFRELFGRPPSALRAQRRGVDNSARDGVTLRLAYRPPYDWPGMLAALAPRARRRQPSGSRTTCGTAGSSSTAAAAPSRSPTCRERNSVPGHHPLPRGARRCPRIVARVRRVFDLGADIATIGSHLARDPKLAPLIAKRPGLRAPGDWERETMVDRRRRTTSRQPGGPGTPMPPNISGWPPMVKRKTEPLACWSTGCKRRSASC